MVIEENPVKHYYHKQIAIRIICAVVILLSGIAIGTGGTILLVKHRIIRLGRPHKDAAVIAKEISKKYGLNEQQAKQVEDVFNRAFEQRQMQREERDRQREQETQTLIAEMKTILTDQQFERWNKDFQELRENFRKPPKK